MLRLELWLMLMRLALALQLPDGSSLYDFLRIAINMGVFNDVYAVFSFRFFNRMACCKRQGVNGYTRVYMSGCIREYMRGV